MVKRDELYFWRQTRRLGRVIFCSLKEIARYLRSTSVQLPQNSEKPIRMLKVFGLGHAESVVTPSVISDSTASWDGRSGMQDLPARFDASTLERYALVAHDWKGRGRARNAREEVADQV